MRKTTEWRFLRLLGCSVPVPRIVDLMQMLAYFIATAAATSLIVSLLYLATFKASDSTYPPDAIVLKMYLEKTFPRFILETDARINRPIPWSNLILCSKQSNGLLVLHSQINLLVENSFSEVSNWFVRQSRVCHLTSGCWLEIFAIIPATLLELKSKKLLWFKLCVRLFGFAYEPLSFFSCRA